MELFSEREITVRGGREGVGSLHCRILCLRS
jgi:hypothetical protein